MGRSFPELTPSALQSAEDLQTLSEDGQAFVSLDDRGFIDGAGHYLIYGSEFLCGFAAGLNRGSGRDYRQVLKDFGVPTIFRIRLPLDHVEENDFSQFLALIYDHTPTARKSSIGPEVDFTFRLNRPLPANCVLSHVHPKRVIDPLLGMTPYFPERSSG